MTNTRPSFSSRVRAMYCVLPSPVSHSNSSCLPAFYRRRELLQRFLSDHANIIATNTIVISIQILIIV
ncbi:MAG: hypothetical protein ACTSXP_11020 [Promethearchaeota archaeon]